MTIRVSGSPRPITPPAAGETASSEAAKPQASASASVEAQPGPRIAPDAFVPGHAGHAHAHGDHGHAHGVGGHAHVHGVHCGTEEPQGLPPELQSRIQEAIHARGVAPSSLEPVVIDVYFHVINNGEGIENGDIPQEMIDAQIEVLNETYKETPFSFRLVSVGRHTNPEWYRADPRTDAERDMKESLHTGGAADLNFYTNSPARADLLGWAAFPWNQEENPKLDGVVHQFQTLPGGTYAPVNEGKTATHEVGHWLGLYHTFQDPFGEGDFIEDTPPHHANQGTPPMGTDTIPELPGLDPVHNYMNYVDDAHMTEFTPGQIERMELAWEVFRGPESDAVEEPAEADGEVSAAELRRAFSEGAERA